MSTFDYPVSPILERRYIAVHNAKMALLHGKRNMHSRIMRLDRLEKAIAKRAFNAWAMGIFGVDGLIK